MGGNMNIDVWIGVTIPFLGTSLGAACVFFMKGAISSLVRKVLTGFAAGVMVAASFWSLLEPALEQAETMGKLSCWEWDFCCLLMRLHLICIWTRRWRDPKVN